MGGTESRMDVTDNKQQRLVSVEPNDRTSAEGNRTNGSTMAFVLECNVVFSMLCSATVFSPTKQQLVGALKHSDGCCWGRINKRMAVVAAAAPTIQRGRIAQLLYW